MSEKATAELTIRDGLSLYSQIKSQEVVRFINQFKELKSPLGSLGFYGVPQAKEYWLIDKIIPKLEKIKKEFEEIEEMLRE